MNSIQAGRLSRFEGRIAGFGTKAGPRLVIGMWERSPFGRFADVMVESDSGHRLLMAPSEAVAEYVSSTYTFDEVQVVEVRFGQATGGEGAGGDLARRIRISAGPLEVTLQIGGPTAVGRLLRSVPRAFAVHPVWLQAIDPVARMLVPGARTSGSAGGGRREFYGVTRARAITAVDATWEGSALGGVQRLEPPVTFGFGSAPATPTLVDIVTTIRERA
ncbi:hypothetical protein [Subtercola boreus]|uniref:hypothetical protein n=1 Tax=Subtercola boreus TaxID=120213 RepID=UPI00209C1426|nr:hypothetical protein [Subtercola boreus]